MENVSQMWEVSQVWLLWCGLGWVIFSFVLAMVVGKIASRQDREEPDRHYLFDRREAYYKKGAL